MLWVKNMQMLNIVAMEHHFVFSTFHAHFRDLQLLFLLLLLFQMIYELIENDQTTYEVIVLYLSILRSLFSL